MKEYLSISELSQIIGVHSRTIYRWRNNGKYPWLFTVFEGAEGNRPIIKIHIDDLQRLKTLSKEEPYGLDSIG